MTVKEKSQEQLDLPFEHRVNDIQSMKDYVLAGNAKFTLKSQQTGKHLTFKVRRGKQKDVWWVNRLSDGYEYIGMIDRNGVFRWTTAVPLELRSCEHFSVFSWFWAKINYGTLSGHLQFYHRGKCGKCGRDLTDPLSIKLGFGPGCRKKR